MTCWSGLTKKCVNQSPKGLSRVNHRWHITCNDRKDTLQYSSEKHTIVLPNDMINDLNHSRSGISCTITEEVLAIKPMTKLIMPKNH